MKKLHAFKILQGWDKKGRYVFTRQDLSKVFFKDTPKALTESLNRLVHDGWIIRACRGVYVNPHAHFSLDGYALFQKNVRKIYVFLSLHIHRQALCNLV